MAGQSSHITGSKDLDLNMLNNHSDIVRPCLMFFVHLGKSKNMKKLSSRNYLILCRSPEVPKELTDLSSN